MFPCQARYVSQSVALKPGDLMRPQAFFYDWIDRTAFKKGKPLPDKVGSLQCFLNGFTGEFPFRRPDFLSEPLV